MHNPPIDILEIALRRYARAVEEYRATFALQASEAAAVVGAQAYYARNAAQADVGAVNALAFYVEADQRRCA